MTHSSSEGKRLLVVDDEPVILDAAQEVLSNLGFEVLAFDSPVNALEQAQTTFESPVLCAVVDCELPGLSGPEFYDQIQKQKPDLPVVFISGYDQPELAKTCAKHPSKTFLRKPFRFDTLLERIEEVTKTS